MQMKTELSKYSRKYLKQYSECNYLIKCLNSTYKVTWFRLLLTQITQVTSELLDGVTSGVSAVIPSRILIIRTSGVDDMDITRLSKSWSMLLFACLNHLSSLLYLMYLGFYLMRCSCIIKRFIISCMENTCLCSPSIKFYQLNAFINTCSFLNILISFILNDISENTVLD